MQQYFIFDTLIQNDKTTSFTIASRSLTELLGIDAIPFKGAKIDVGSEVLGLDKMKFYRRNAYNISLASMEKRDIICTENSAFTSFAMTKDALLNDFGLRNDIEELLKKDDMILNLEAKIYKLEEVLINDIGIEKLTQMVQNPFDKFQLALFFGTSGCKTKKYTNIDFTTTLLDIIKAKRIKYDSAYDSDGFEVLQASPLLAKQLAARTMLDMFDNAADFVLVNDARSFVMFDAYQKELERTAQREIGLSVLTLPQLLLLAFGVTDKKRLGINNHKVAVTLI